MILATSEKNVCGFIEFELIKLAERINVSGNLTPDQVEHIALQLVQMYPNETIADFKICFEKGASGVYGKIFKLDGVEIGVWMRVYLDDKYQVMENEMMKEKDNLWQKNSQNTDWLKLWKEAVEETDAEGGVKTTSKNIAFLNHLRALTDKEIREEGQREPKRTLHKVSDEEKLIRIAKQKLQRAASEFYKGRRGSFDLKKFEAEGIEFFAESEEDAVKIYELACEMK